MSVQVRTVLILSIAAILALALFGCGEDERPEANVQALLLARVPCDGGVQVQRAVVTIAGVYLSAPDDPDADAAGRLWLNQTPQTVDLMGLSNEPATLVGGTAVPITSYDELRMVLTGAYVEVAESDGTTRIFASSEDYDGLPSGTTASGTLTMPSASATGIPIGLAEDGFAVGEGGRDLLVEMDITASLTPSGGGWALNPVLGAVNMDTLSTIEVEASLAPSVTMPTVDGSQATIEDIEAQLCDAGGSGRGLMLGSVDNDPASEAVFELVNPAQAPWSVDLVSNQGLSVASDPDAPLEVEVPEGETTAYVFTITDVEGGSN